MIPCSIFALRTDVDKFIVEQQSDESLSLGKCSVRRKVGPKATDVICIGPLRLTENTINLNATNCFRGVDFWRDVFLCKCYKGEASGNE